MFLAKSAPDKLLNDLASVQQVRDAVSIPTRKVETRDDGSLNVCVVRARQLHLVERKSTKIAYTSEIGVVLRSNLQR